ncbi:hypothetical protein HK102_003080 [Quaeritorhiza haematococci]|nr:hypothetical protein HK102_003080 [Quaeritorhiza haematococci]
MLNTLLLHVNTSPTVFYDTPPNGFATSMQIGSNWQTVFPHSDQGSSLQSIYTNLQSPCPIPIDVSSGNLATEDAEDYTLLRKCLTDTHLPGMRSSLYTYQQNSLWKILQRECFPQLCIDPDLITSRTVDNTEYFIRLSTLQVFAHPTFYSDATGGIIAEDMGLGKTCICISLIAATKHHVSAPPVGETILTDLKTLSSTSTESDAAVDDVHHVHIVDTVNRVPTLKGLAAKQVLVSRIRYKNMRDWIPPHILRLLSANPPYFLKYRSGGQLQHLFDDGNQNNQSLAYSSGRHRRGTATSNPQPIKIFLSSSTLVVVPNGLVHQWLTEVNKHTLDLALRVLVIVDSAQPIPPATELVEYDMVLISHSRFARENATGGMDFEDTRNGDSSKGTKGYISPLLQVHWLRLIVDEGHTMAGNRGNATDLASKLSVERRWACTGTPMPFVLADRNESEQDDWARDNLHKLDKLVSTFLRIEPFGSDKDAFKSLIIKSFTSKISRTDEASSKGKEARFLRFCAAMRLKKLMERIMVRHRKEDIERCVELPPLYVSTTVLPFNRFQRLTYNALMAFIGANAVLSEREHQDYFFHPSNVKSLKQIVGAIRASCFWWLGNSLWESMTSTLENVTEGLDHKDVRGYSADDVALLQKCAFWLRTALGDNVFRGVAQAGGDVVYSVNGVADVIQRSILDTKSWSALVAVPRWTIQPQQQPKVVKRKVAFNVDCGESEDNHHQSSEPLGDTSGRIGDAHNDSRATMHLPEQQQSSIPSPTSSPNEGNTCLMVGFSLELLQEELRLSSHQHNNIASSQASDDKGGAQQTTKNASSEDNHRSSQHIDVEDASMLLESSTDAENNNLETPLNVSHANSIGARNPSSTLASPHPARILELKELRRWLFDQSSCSINAPGEGEKDMMMIMGTSSPKLTYIIDQIRTWAPRGEKIMVWTQFTNAIYYVHEACRLMKIKCLLYHKRMPASERSQNVTTFNTSNTIAVIIMDTSCGAWGVDLSSASRVYFLEPVWEIGKEQQAIKRAHRIGCTKPVYVETLVMRGSVEEAIFKRKKELPDHECKSLIDDGKLRSILSSATFIDEPDEPSDLHGTSCFSCDPIRIVFRNGAQPSGGKSADSESSNAEAVRNTTGQTEDNDAAFYDDLLVSGLSSSRQTAESRPLGGHQMTSEGPGLEGLNNVHMHDDNSDTTSTRRDWLGILGFSANEEITFMEDDDFQDHSVTATMVDDEYLHVSENGLNSTQAVKRGGKRRKREKLGEVDRSVSLISQNKKQRSSLKVDLKLSTKGEPEKKSLKRQKHHQRS